MVMACETDKPHLNAAGNVPGAGSSRMFGRTEQAARAERVQAFQAGEGDLFLISLRAGNAMF